MKKHILSRYAEIKIIDIAKDICSDGPTILTENIESSDEDGFQTNIATSNSGFCLSMGPTKSTYVIESTDEDSYLPSFV